MNHLSEEQLESFVLGTLSQEDTVAVREHLAQCVECSARVDALVQLPEALSGIEPAVIAPPVPFPHKRRQLQTGGMRVAAAVVFGFAAGMMAARQTCGPAVLIMDDFSVSQRVQRVTLAPVSCAVVDLVGL
jgi:anti-sigma factor RsiW